MRLPFDTESLERLLIRCQRGDEDAWSRLIEETSDLVWSVARRQGMKEDDAADVFQGTYLALYGSLASLRSGQALPKWLGVTAARECHRVRLRTSRMASVDPEPILDGIPDTGSSAAETYQADVDAFLTRRALVELGGRCRDLLQMLYFQESADYVEIAQAIGMPVGSIGPTRARCLAKLKKILEKEGFFTDDVSSEELATSGRT
jgi:RNA polymerase sigma factor (sigma-70 family)